MLAVEPSYAQIPAPAGRPSTLEENMPSQPDYMFPARGQSMVMVATGVPYLGVTELSYGFTERFSASLLLGQTPLDTGIGFGVRGIVSNDSNGDRTVFRMPFFYYPPDSEPEEEPWILAWPSVLIESLSPGGRTLSVGLGLVGAACVDALTERLGGSHEHTETILGGGGLSSPLPGADEHTGETRTDDFMGGIWYTITVGMSAPIASDYFFRAEITSVMAGGRLAGSDWIGGPPVILTIGISHGL